MVYICTSHLFTASCEMLAALCHGRDSAVGADSFALFWTAKAVLWQPTPFSQPSSSLAALLVLSLTIRAQGLYKVASKLGVVRQLFCIDYVLLLCLILAETFSTLIQPLISRWLKNRNLQMQMPHKSYGVVN